MSLQPQSRPSKRPRVEVGGVGGPSGTEGSPLSSSATGKNDITDTISLKDLLTQRQWDEAIQRVSSHPEEVTQQIDSSSSPLALACRSGASFECIKTILEARPDRLRHLLDSRGTPLHEAIVCEDIGVDVIRILLRTDESLGKGTPRAAILQDVDGYTPLHLLIRRRFQSHVLGTDPEDSLMQILELLMKSCAEAVVIPDRGEYEEPPIVMALKANVYAPHLPGGEETGALVEDNIYKMVQLILKYYPQAASCCFNGFRGQYTALHSAVFHGRCPETISLLLEAEKRAPSEKKAALLGNTQGELPLHFCAMRGEPPRTVSLLASAAPEALSTRDASGLTPIHWLWARYISTILGIDEAGRTTLITLPLSQSAKENDISVYNEFTCLQRGEFEADLQFIRRLDPAVDFLRMRHIPVEILGEEESMQWAGHTVNLLKRIRDRHNKDALIWTREEAITSFFWNKVVSMIKAETSAQGRPLSDDFTLVHAAFSACSCPPAVARIVADMFPEDISRVDRTGRLPLHYAGMRAWHAWDWPREDGTSDSANARLLRRESVALLRVAMDVSPPHAAHHLDDSNCLPLHYAIRTFSNACRLGGRTCSENPIDDMLGIISKFVMLNPDSLHTKDPATGLYPFLQASAVSTQEREVLPLGSTVPFPDEHPLSLVYLLLRENPSFFTGAENQA